MNGSPRIDEIVDLNMKSGSCIRRRGEELCKRFFAPLLGCVDAGSQKAVNAADPMAVGLFAEVVLDLHLVAPAQIDTAVVLLWGSGTRHTA
jgi:hypothetical protein